MNRTAEFNRGRVAGNSFLTPWEGVSPLVRIMIHFKTQQAKSFFFNHITKHRWMYYVYIVHAYTSQTGRIAIIPSSFQCVLVLWILDPYNTTEYNVDILKYTGVFQLVFLSSVKDHLVDVFGLRKSQATGVFVTNTNSQNVMQGFVLLINVASLHASFIFFHPSRYHKRPDRSANEPPLYSLHKSISSQQPSRETTVQQRARYAGKGKIAHVFYRRDPIWTSYFKFDCNEEIMDLNRISFAG